MSANVVDIKNNRRQSTKKRCASDSLVDQSTHSSDNVNHYSFMNRYSIEQGILGQGGQATILKAFDNQLNKDVAIKAF